MFSGIGIARSSHSRRSESSRTAPVNEAATVKSVIEDPNLILGELRRIQKSEPAVDAQVDGLRKDVKQLKGQEARLVRLFEFGEISERVVRERARALRDEREGLERLLQDLERQAEAVRGGRLREEEIFSYCAQVRDRLVDFDFEGKRLAFRALEIKAAVSPDQVVVNGVVPLSEPAIITTARTSGCRFVTDKRRTFHGQYA